MGAITARVGAITARVGDGRLTPATIAILLSGAAAALVVRAILLPGPGLAGDLDLFIGWARTIAGTGLGRAYELPLSFPPVLPWIWAGLAVIDPALRTAAPGDPAIDALMKLPATIADLGLAAVVGWWLRARPGWAVAGALAVLLAPPVIYDSAWWGQFESIYVLPVLVAMVLAAHRRYDLAAVLVGVALMTKPQALPLIVPLTAWYAATTGRRGLIRAAIVVAAVIVLVWLPFLPYGGPASYAGSLGTYENQLYNAISVRAWNPWWLAQLAFPGTDLVSDSSRLLGPITLRWIGIAAALAALGVVWLRIRRRPNAVVLAWGMAAATLGSFSLLTTMHERYSYPALVFLPLVWPNRLALVTWLALVVAITANMVAAVPPNGAGAVVPLGGLVGLLGSLTMIAATVACFIGLARATRSEGSQAAGSQAADVQPGPEVA